MSPTRMLVDRVKGDEPQRRAKVLSKFSKGFFFFELTWCGTLMLLSLWPTVQTHWSITGISLLYAWSRCHEIFYAFSRDAVREIKGESGTSTLKRSDRIVMAMRSYVGLTINFALLYYYMPFGDLFNKPFPGFFDAVYFSGVTITTLGYGDIHPEHWVSRTLVLYEVFTGILLVVVAIGAYLGTDPKKPLD